MTAVACVIPAPYVVEESTTAWDVTVQQSPSDGGFWINFNHLNDYSARGGDVPTGFEIGVYNETTGYSTHGGWAMDVPTRVGIPYAWCNDPIDLRALEGDVVHFGIGYMYDNTGVLGFEVLTASLVIAQAFPFNLTNSPAPGEAVLSWEMPEGFVIKPADPLVNAYNWYVSGYDAPEGGNNVYNTGFDAGVETTHHIGMPDGLYWTIRYYARVPPGTYLGGFQVESLERGGPIVNGVLPVGPPTSHDNLVNARTLSLAGGNEVYDNTGNTHEDDELDPWGDGDMGWMGGSAWYKVTPPSDTTLTIDTFGTLNEMGGAGDTTLDIFTGPSNASNFTDLTSVAVNDDGGPSGQPYTSQIVLALTGGTTYYVRVMDLVSDPGDRSLHLHVNYSFQGA